MTAPRRETSAETAARFLASRARPGAASRGRADGRWIDGRWQPRQAPPRQPAPRRIAVDFADPTLRLIHDVLLDAIHANIEFGDRGALLMIAEQMVAVALGAPPCDDPPLTDREGG